MGGFSLFSFPYYTVKIPCCLRLDHVFLVLGDLRGWRISESCYCIVEILWVLTIFDELISFPAGCGEISYRSWW